MVYLIHPTAGEPAVRKALLTDMKPITTGSTVGGAIFVDSTMTWDEMRNHVGTRGMVARVDNPADQEAYKRKETK